MKGSRRTTFWAIAASVLGGAGLLLGTASVASATPTQLLVPQGTAFSYLGHSCGGIQEQVYATGFDSSNGFPDGDAYLSTRCGGSGRGGGGVSTLYSAWVTAQWDFTGVLVSSSRLVAAPPIDPTFSATDANGNQVSNSSGRAYLTLSPTFTPQPRVTGLSVSTGPSSGGTAVTLSGTGLTGATTVGFDGTTVAPTVVNDNTLTLVTPALAIAATTDTVDAIVTTGGGPSAPTSADQFTFVAAPTISSLSPDSGAMAGGTAVTITGANLSPVTSVMFGDQGAGFTVDGDTSITAYAPATDSSTPDSSNVTVRSIGGTSNGLNYDYTSAIAPSDGPVVTSLSPASGPAGGHTRVTITGQNFAGASAVTFGGVEASGFTVGGTGTTITALSPPDTVDLGPQVDVQVTGPGGSSPIVAADVFSYVAPKITRIGPHHGSAAGGTRVHIRGSGFSGVSAVTFGGVEAARFTVNRAGTVIVAVTPPEFGVGTQSVDVSVSSAAGTGTLPAAFTYR